MTKTSLRRLGAAGLIGGCALVAAGATAVGAKSGAGGRATRGTIYIADTPRSGAPGILYVAGDAVDKVLGEGAITFTIKAIPNSATGTVTAKALKVTMWTANGSLTGTGSATLTIESNGNSTATGGKVSLTKGTGGQRGHSLTATFSGKGKVAGALYTFKYKGTYK